MLHLDQVCISSCWRDNGPQIYWGHDLDLSGSRDATRIPIGHFVLVVHWIQVSISNGFRDIVPQTSCAYRHSAKSSLRMRDITWHIPPMQKLEYIFQFLTSTLPIHYVTFIGLRWRIRDVLSVTFNVKGKIERKFSKSKNLPNFDLLGTLEIRGYAKLRFLLQRHILAWIHVDWAILRENRLRGLTSRAVAEKKVRKSREAPIGMMCRR